MAQIILSSSEKIEVGYDEANNIAGLWRDPAYKGTIRLGDREIKKHLIKRIDFGKQAKSFEYEISNSNHKEIIREFEMELRQISDEDPEKKDFSFDWWCVKNGIFIKGKENRTYYNGSYGFEPHWYKKYENYSINSSKIDEYNDALNKRKALDALIAARAQAKKHEHIQMLGSEECQDKPGTPNRCEMCYPTPWREKIKGFSLRNKSDPNEDFYGHSVVDDDFKKLERKNEEKNKGLDKKMTEQVDSGIDKNGMCKKCGELEDECKCIDPNDLPF